MPGAVAADPQTLLQFASTTPQLLAELLAIEEEPARICGHDAALHGGCKGKPINKVKAGQCPIGLEIRRCRAGNKRCRGDRILLVR